MDHGTVKIWRWEERSVWTGGVEGGFQKEGVLGWIFEEERGQGGRIFQIRKQFMYNMEGSFPALIEDVEMGLKSWCWGGSHSNSGLLTVSRVFVTGLGKQSLTYQKYSWGHFQFERRYSSSWVQLTALDIVHKTDLRRPEWWLEEGKQTRDLRTTGTAWKTQVVVTCHAENQENQPEWERKAAYMPTEGWHRRWGYRIEVFQTTITKLCRRSITNPLETNKK